MYGIKNMELANNICEMCKFYDTKTKYKHTDCPGIMKRRRCPWIKDIIKMENKKGWTK